MLFRYDGEDSHMDYDDEERRSSIAWSDEGATSEDEEWKSPFD